MPNFSAVRVQMVSVLSKDVNTDIPKFVHCRMYEDETQESMKQRNLRV